MIIDHMNEIESWPDQYKRLRDLHDAQDYANLGRLQEYYHRRDKLIDTTPAYLQRQN